MFMIPDFVNFTLFSRSLYPIFYKSLKNGVFLEVNTLTEKWWEMAW